MSHLLTSKSNLLFKLPKGSALVGAFSLFNILLAFARQSTIANIFGASAEIDAFFVALTIPQLLVISAVAVSVGVVLPAYVEEREQGNDDRAEALVKNWILFIAFILIAICAILFLFAEPIVRILGPGLSATQHSLASRCFRWLLIFLWFGAIGGAFKAVLDAHQKFAMPQLAPALVSFWVVVSAVALHESLGVGSLALGFVAGGMLGFVIQWVAATRLERGLIFLWKTGVRIRLPIVAGLTLICAQSVGQINNLIDRFFASYLSEGSIGILVYAQALNSIPSAILGTALATALFPKIAKMTARGESSQVLVLMRRWIFTIVALGPVPVIGIVIFRGDLVVLAFQRGQFNAAATEATSAVLAILPFTIIISICSTLLVHLLLVQQRQGAILIISILGVSLKLLLSLYFVSKWGLVGLVGATVVAGLIATSVRYVVAMRRF